MILEGTSAPNHAAATAMPSFGAAYTDVEIAAVANYAIAHWILNGQKKWIGNHPGAMCR